MNDELKTFARDAWVALGFPPETFEAEWRWYATRADPAAVEASMPIVQAVREARRMVVAAIRTDTGGRDE